MTISKDKNIILPIITLLILLITGCPQPHDKISKPGSSSSGGNAGVGSNSGAGSLPPPAVHDEGVGNFTKDDLFTVFDLKSKEGRITASEAAKKVRDASPIGTTFTFISREALAYDDEAGTFKVKVVGKKNGEDFDKTFEVKGFTHPYASPPQSAISVTFNFDYAIENNISIDSYVEKIKDDLKAYLTFSFYLQNAKIITLGEVNDHYELTAQVSKPAELLKISPTYKLTYKQKLEDKDETSVKKEYTSAMSAFNTQKKPYFTTEDVFKYVLSKTNDNFVKADDTKFASSIYALAKTAAAAPEGLFDMTQIQTYVDKYRTKDAGEHLQLDIQAGIYNPKNSGIDANDMDGSLTVQYCLATSGQLEHQINGSHPDLPAINAKTSTKEITREGFKRADENTLKDLFNFTIMPQGMDSATSNTEWSNYAMPGVPQGQLTLVSKKESGIGYEYKPFPDFNSKPFKIFVNSSDNPATVFTVDTPPYLSTGTGDVKILLNEVVLNKKAGERDLTVTYTLSNKESINVTYTPSF